MTTFGNTMVSLVRVMGTDGDNVTMKDFVQNRDVFSAECSRSFTKIIDDVPNGVELSTPVVPYPARPLDLRLTLSNVTNLHLKGQFRVRSPLRSISRYSH